MTSSARYRAFIGGVGSGKSHAGAIAALMEIAKGRSLGMVIAPTYPMLRDATLRTFLDVNGDYVSSVNRSEMTVLMDTGAEVLFRSADAPDRLRGPNASWAWLDEAGQLPNKDTWQVVIGRLRQDGKAGRAWVTSTPKGFNWLYELFGEPGVEQSGGEVETFTARTEDNRYLSPDFVHTLKRAYSGAFARQELDGAFLSVDGSVFRRVRDAIQEGAFPMTPYEGTFIGGIDWGQANDFTVAIIMDAATRRVVDMLRINKVDWAFQRVQVKALCDKWHVHTFVAEANSIGQPNIEALVAQDVPVFPFTTTNASKALIVQRGIMDFEEGAIGIPNEPNLVSELEAFEGEQTSTGLMKYGAVPGAHDDCVMALLLANYGCQAVS